MELMDYFKQRKRMMISLGGTGDSCEGIDCGNCPFDMSKGCVYGELEGVKIIESWRDKHPEKRVIDDLLEKFPDADVDSLREVQACPKWLGYEVDCITKKCEDCWDLPIE